MAEAGILLTVVLLPPLKFHPPDIAFSLGTLAVPIPVLSG
jgi:hypothetical protein